jgi:hypothetical protein
MISFMLIIFTFQLIKTIRILWFCHRSNGTDYEFEIAIARVHTWHLELFDDPALEEKQDDQIAKELKTRENRQTAARSYRKMGR